MTDENVVMLSIQRTGGQQFVSSVQYSTVLASGSVTVGSVTFPPANSGEHLVAISSATVTFAIQEVW